MLRLFSILLLAAPSLSAEVPARGDVKNPVSLLPDGSVLKGVLLPRYDENHNLIGDLKVETMTLIDSERLQGENVRIRFFNPDRSLRGKAELDHAFFDQAKSRLFANEPVEITTDRLVARGDGLVHHPPARLEEMRAMAADLGGSFHSVVGGVDGGDAASAIPS